ncbi:DUF11 domain-containing protein [bacterium]|nr:DUF11 domain-containing protein [candidate division CSSED10-310 bacterium]
MKRGDWFWWVTVAMILVMALAAPEARATYTFRIPHTVEFTCEEGTGGYTGHWGLGVVWNTFAGATGYTVISHNGAYGGGHVGPDVSHWGIGGGSPVAPGGCAAIEASVNIGWYQDNYELWATFDEGGNLELHKTDNIYGAARPGDEVRYFLIYKNTGRYPLLDCIVEESWPVYMHYVAGGNPNGSNSVTWDFGTLLPGHWRQVELVLRIDEELPRSITEIFNVAVVHPAPSPAPTPMATPPSGTSMTVGYAVGFCDSLRCNVVYGDAEWIDRPLSSTYEPLAPYYVVRGNDEVRLNSGYASFNHTVATGTILLLQGGFRLTDCRDLEDDVLSEITLFNPSSYEQAVSGIMNPDEHVKVAGRFLTVEVNNARYTFTGETDRETVAVESGVVIVVDPDGDRHELHNGDEFTWPVIIGASPPDNGPVLVGTDPPDFGSTHFNNVTITYQFDQPVLGLGTDSSLCFGETSGIWQSTGTLEDLSADGRISMTWNAENDAVSIFIANPSPWLGVSFSGGMTLVVTLHLVDVQGAEATTSAVYETMSLFLVMASSSLGWVNQEFENFSFITQANNLLQPGCYYSFRQLPELPAPLPEGMYAVGPAFEFQFDGDVLDHYWLQLRPTTECTITAADIGGGIFSWDGANWNLQREGFGSAWTWTEPLTDPQQVLVLASSFIRPEVPEVLSVEPALFNGPVGPETPISIRVAARSGIRTALANVMINGVRTMTYDPATGEVGGWEMTAEDGVTTLTYIPATGWREGQMVYGSYYLPAGFGLIPAEGTFAFQVAWTDNTDGDGDDVPDAWEDANEMDSSRDDSNEDPDGDDFPNWIEFMFLSSPATSLSLPAIPGIDLYSNQESYFRGDDMVFKARVSNGPMELPVDLYIVVEILGAYYCWPAFTTDLAPMSFTMPANFTADVELLAYTWEEAPEVLTLTWYGAVLDPASLYVYSLDTLAVTLER